MSVSDPQMTNECGFRPFISAHGIHNLLHLSQADETNTVEFNRLNNDYPKTNSEHELIPQPCEHGRRTGRANEGVQLPAQCLYQYSAASHNLYSLYQPWQTSHLYECQDKRPNADETGINYRRDGFADASIREKSVEPTCVEPLSSPVHLHYERGSHSSSASGSPYMSSTEPPISSHSSSGYGSSSGSTSSSPFPSPGLPDPAPPKKLETDSLAATPTGDCSTVKPKKARTSYTAEQIHSLETAFEENAYPDYDKLEELAKTLGVTERKVKVWFQNKRARWRKKHAAEPVYNPNMYSAPTPVTSKFPAPAFTGFPTNASSGYTQFTKPYSRHTKYPTPTNYPMPSQYQSPGPLSGLYPPYPSALYPSHASVPPSRIPSISCDAVETTTSSTIGYLPSSTSEHSGQTFPYGASPYSHPQYQAPQMLSLS